MVWRWCEFNHSSIIVWQEMGATSYKTGTILMPMLGRLEHNFFRWINKRYRIPNGNQKWTIRWQKLGKSQNSKHISMGAFWTSWSGNIYPTICSVISKICGHTVWPASSTCIQLRNAAAVDIRDLWIQIWSRNNRPDEFKTNDSDGIVSLRI